jgi:hypothetical protein
MVERLASGACATTTHEIEHRDTVLGYRSKTTIMRCGDRSIVEARSDNKRKQGFRFPSLCRIFKRLLWIILAILVAGMAWLLSPSSRQTTEPAIIPHHPTVSVTSGAAGLTNLQTSVSHLSQIYSAGTAQLDDLIHSSANPPPHLTKLSRKLSSIVHPSTLSLQIDKLSQFSVDLQTTNSSLASIAGRLTNLTTNLRRAHQSHPPSNTWWQPAFITRFLGPSEYEKLLHSIADELGATRARLAGIEGAGTCGSASNQVLDEPEAVCKRTLRDEDYKTGWFGLGVVFRAELCPAVDVWLDGPDGEDGEGDGEGGGEKENDAVNLAKASVALAKGVCRDLLCITGSGWCYGGGPGRKPLRQVRHAVCGEKHRLAKRVELMEEQVLSALRGKR